MKLINHTFNTTFVISEHNESKMNNEDIQPCYNAIGAVIKNNKNQILIQKHVKYNIFTIPIGKCPSHISHDIGLRREMLEECDIHVNTLLHLDRGDLVFELFSGQHITVHSCLIEVLGYNGVIKNMQPDKHEFQKFIDISDIQNLGTLSYITQLYLNKFVKK